MHSSFPRTPPVVRTPPVKSPKITLWEDGVRYLTNEYQYVTLYIMIGFATRGGKHLAMAFEDFSTPNNATYQVPAELVSLRDHFDQQARGFDGATTKQTIKCRSVDERNWLRNHYLHRVHALRALQLEKDLQAPTPAGPPPHEAEAGRTGRQRRVSAGLRP